MARKVQKQQNNPQPFQKIKLIRKNKINKEISTKRQAQSKQISKIIVKQTIKLPNDINSVATKKRLSKQLETDKDLKNYFIQKCKKYTKKRKDQIPTIFQYIWSKYCLKYNPKLNCITIKLCDNDGKRKIVDKLKSYYKEGSQDSYWAKIRIIIGKCPSLRLFQISKHQQQIGFICIKYERKKYTLQIMHIQQKYNKKNYEQVVLGAVRQYYTLEDRINKRSQSFKQMNINKIENGTQKVWKKIRSRLNWLKFNSQIKF